MTDTLHAYEHVRSIYFPIAVAVFVLVAGALALLLVAGSRRRAGARTDATRFEAVYAVVSPGSSRSC